MYLFITSTILSFLSVHSNHLGKPVSILNDGYSVNIHLIHSQILKWLNIPTDKECDLLSRKRQLLSEQSVLSMVDNFAKYSKLQRQINVIDQELADLQNQRSYNNFKYKYFFMYGLKIIVYVLLFVLSIYYRTVPVFSVPRKFDLTPFTKLIAYPNKDNDVSFHFWVICCTTIAKLIPVTSNQIKLWNVILFN